MLYTRELTNCMSVVFDELTSLTGFPSRLISIDDFTLGVFFSVIFLHVSLFQLGSSFQVSGSLQSLTSAFGPPGKYVLGIDTSPSFLCCFVQCPAILI